MKHIVKNTTIVRIFILLLSFFSSPLRSEDPSEKILNKIIQEYIDEMDEKYGLTCSGSGGTTHDKIESIHLSLIAFRRASLEEARQIHVGASERLIEMINNNRDIRPFLNNHPYSKENCSVSISYRRPQETHFSDGSVAVSIYGKGKIFYESREIFTPGLVSLYEESYEEALQSVRDHPLSYDVREHKDVGYEKELDKLSVEFARNVHKKYGIFCETFGGRFSSSIDQVAFSLVRKKSTPLVKARKYEVEITQMLLDMINKNEALRPYLCQYPFTAKQTAIRIQSIHGQGVLFQDGSISRVMQQEGTISYFKEKAPTKYTPVHTEADLILQESFEEAQKNLKKRG